MTTRFQVRDPALALFVLLFGLALTGCRSSEATKSPPPNIVVILADDMGWGDPGCYNPESKTPTPHIDRLALAGMRFTDAHAPGSVCVPTRYGLLTGRRPPRRLPWGRKSVIDRGVPTLASVLRDGGYRTEMIGKWHLGFDGGAKRDWSKPITGGPVDRGFDSWFGIPASLDIPPYYYVRDRTPVTPATDRVAASNTDGWTKIQGAFWRAGGVAAGFRHVEVLPRFTEEAERVIERGAKAAEPFFLYLALPAPHTPWLPTEEFAGASGASMYGDFVTQVDATVGRVLRALERQGIADNTLVVFTSDNGPVWYPKDVERFGHRSTGPFRGMKGDAWEGGHRMPFVVRWPGRVAPGSECNQTICFTDLMRTFARIAGRALPSADTLDSFDLAPLLAGHDEPVREVTIHKQAATAIRAGNWKLITHLGSGGFSKPRRRKASAGEPKGQLYDLAADPGETRNLWNDHPAVVRRLQTLLGAAK